MARNARPPAARSASRPAARAETKQRTREALVQAAVALFAEEGLDVSLDAVCDRAGFTRGAFYVHFADREALLVAAMDQVGAAFLASMFAASPVAEAPPAPRRPRARAARPSPAAVATVAARFARAVEDGSYPLMGPPGSRSRIRMHQLLDACARSPVVRERYRGLVEGGTAAVAHLLEEDVSTQAVRADVVPAAVAELFVLALVGAQCASELGAPLDVERLSATMLGLLAPPPPRS